MTSPSISALQVQAGGTEASVSFTISEPTAIAFALNDPPVDPAPERQPSQGPLDDEWATLADGAAPPPAKCPWPTHTRPSTSCH